MSDRTVRLCDSTDSAGKLCDGVFEPRVHCATGTGAAIT